MRKSFLFLCLSAALSPAAALAQGYQAKVGDHAWVIVRQFPARGYAQAKKQYLRDIWAKFGGDKLTRDHILAEDLAHHRLVTVIFAPSRAQAHRQAASRVDRLAMSKRNDWYRIAMISDESIVPAVGDELTLYENHYPKRHHEYSREPQRKLIEAMKNDGVDKDAYVFEKPGTGHWGGISIGHAKDHGKLIYGPWAKQIAMHRTSRRVETYRIIAIQDE